jgi:2-dehydro-3-deoxygluconokinase
MTQLTSAQVNWDLLLDTRLLHLTGITPALSPACRAVVAEAVARAVQARIPISFDVNYRQKLWEAETAAAALAPLVQQADIIFCGRSDAQRLFGCIGEAENALRQLAEQMATRAAQVVVMSVGSAGVLAWRNGEILQVDALPVTIVDRLGAGDALAAGVLHGWLDGDLPRGLATGAVTAALALAQHGDMVVTTPQEVESLLANAAGMIVR